MIKLYFINHCYSSKRAREWLTSYNIPFTEINVAKDDLSTSDFLHVLSLTENGIDDILLERSTMYKKYHHSFEESSLSEMISFLKRYRTVIRTPIIVDETKLLVGFTENRARKFLPRFHKNIYFDFMAENKAE